MQPVKIRLGEILVQNNLISKDDLEKALLKGKQTGRKLGRVLVETGRLSESDISKAVANQLKIPFTELTELSLDPENVNKLPENVARKLLVLCIQTSPVYQIAMSDPADVYAYDEIKKLIKTDFDIVATTETSIYQAIDRYYQKSQNIQAIAKELSTSVKDDAFDFAQLQNVGSEEAPVVRLLQSIFEDAIRSRASDIHIEPMESKLVIRFRIDGALYIKNESDVKIGAAVVQRLKLISGLNISEKRLPQDGRFNMRVNASVFDVRIATSPTSFGEAVVMRILNQNAGLLSLERIGMSSEHLSILHDALDHPHGMILVTGPTGSGKTTTLYGALNSLNQSYTKIITVEDPVEYRIDGISQIQVHEKIGLSFHSALRSILRQDPDVILIGEMRDQETVDAALRASMTGHLVLSTLHTNDAASAPARLIDMGAEKFMVASSLHLVMAQRLVKLNCPKCRKPHNLNETEYGWLKYHFKEEDIKNTTFYKGTGCDYCSGTGFYGRSGVYEILQMNKNLVNALYEKDIHGFTSVARESLRGHTLSFGAANLSLTGNCSVAEAKKI